jgi:hypothetical protein
METIFSFKDEDINISKINLDDLYTLNHQKNLEEIALYNKILNRVHIRIKTTSRQRNNSHSCWYIIPEILLGASNYDNASCISYIINKLKDNGFETIYTHPNLLFISWANWTPSYVRSEIKKQTGIVIDGTGNKQNDIIENENDNNNNFILNLKQNNNTKNNISNVKNKKTVQFNDIKNYNPTGKFIYNSELFKNIDDKLN